MKDQLINEWNEMPETRKKILGRPNFSLAGIAHMLKKMGFECANKSEDEQALSIFVMLHFYDKYGEDWAKKMSEFLP